MHQQQNKDSTPRERRMILTLEAYKSGQFQSMRRAAASLLVVEPASSFHNRGPVTLGLVRPSGSRACAAVPTMQPSSTQKKSITINPSADLVATTVVDSPPSPM